MSKQKQNDEKQIETREFLSDESRSANELKIEKHGDDLAVFVHSDESPYDEIVVSDKEDTDHKTRHRIQDLYEDAGANPRTDRLVISPRESGGWDLMRQSENAARAPAKVFFLEGSDEHLQIERLWMVLGGASDESLNKEAFGDVTFDDVHPNGREFSTLVTGSMAKKPTTENLTETLREIEKQIEGLAGDPGPSVRLTRRLEEVLSSMTTKKAGR